MELSLGTVQLGIPYGINNRTGALTDMQAWAVLDTARICGFTMLDTSYEYGDAVMRISQYMRSHPKAFKVVVKYSSRYSPEILQMMIARTQRLFDDKTLSMYWTAGEGVKSLNPEGFDGVTVYDAEEAEAIPAGFRMVQVPASVLDGRMDEEIAELQNRGKIVLVRSLLLQGLIASDPYTWPDGNTGNGEVIGAARPYLASLHRLAAEAGLGVVEIAARWALWLMPDVAIFGAETPAQVRGIMEAIRKGPLPDDLVERLLQMREGIPEIVISPRMWAQRYAFTVVADGKD